MDLGNYKYTCGMMLNLISINVDDYTHHIIGCLHLNKKMECLTT